ncbi:unnamed protein product [Leptidea sinapis]|uniref:RNA helicase n=1 Tax=Leptidea sinapis TaxID=189913 RepID=A0A5E4R1S6_9NEOP|nr:unnamed protein product [Leptidea sinapis]
MVLAHNLEHRTQDVQISQEITFDNMMLSTEVLQGLALSGFHKPSPIQLLGIPIGKLGLDLLLEAKAGTGKTAVFSILALEKININYGLQAIIVAPTREIAAQICDVLNQIGSKIKGDIEKVKDNKVHIVVGTPGRLKSLIQNKHLKVASVRLLILDEADKLMETCFISDIKFIHSKLPKQKQVVLSSATFPDHITAVIDQLVQDAHHVCPAANQVLLGISHRVTYVKSNINSVTQTNLKFKELLKILTGIQFKQCVIFCNYLARVDQIHKMLKQAGWPSQLIYSKQQQTTRLEALKTLQDYKCRILISTDLVSRGIDAKNVDLVINFEAPANYETYLHRIGRSGRFGSIGMAISILGEGPECNKFMTMLAPIKALEIKELWSLKSVQEENVCQDNPLPERHLGIDVNNQATNNHHQDFWKFLNLNDNLLENIESFDQICLSFKENNTQEIEEFNDLLQSFNNNNNEMNTSTTLNNTYEYKHLRFENVPVKDITHELEMFRKLKAYDIDLINIAKDQNSTEEVKANHSISNNLENCNTQTTESSSCYKSINADDNNNANMFASQLPQNFQSSKYKYKTRNEQKFIKNYENHEINIKEEESIPTRREKCKSYKGEHLSSKEFVVPSQSSLYNRKNENKRTKTKNCRPILIDQDESTSNAANYNRWYNRHVQRMHQIEMLLYLEEISNLY